MIAKVTEFFFSAIATIIWKLGFMASDVREQRENARASGAVVMGLPARSSPAPCTNVLLSCDFSRLHQMETLLRAG